METTISKGCDEEEYAWPLAREDGRRKALRGRLKEGMRKVASEPEGSKSAKRRPIRDRSGKRLSDRKHSRFIPVTG